MVKRITALLLTVALMVNLTGYFVIFRYNQLVLHREMATLINSGTVTAGIEIIRVSTKHTNPNLKFSDDSEFYYCDILYDVVTKHVSGDTVTYYCVQDKNEQRLINNYTVFRKHQSETQDSGRSHAVPVHIQLLTDLAFVVKTMPPAPAAGMDFHYPPGRFQLCNAFLPDVSPPPES